MHAIDKLPEFFLREQGSAVSIVDFVDPVIHQGVERIARGIFGSGLQQMYKQVFTNLDALRVHIVHGACSERIIACVGYGQPQAHRFGCGKPHTHPALCGAAQDRAGENLACHSNSPLKNAATANAKRKMDHQSDGIAIRV